MNPTVNRDLNASKGVAPAQLWANYRSTLNTTVESVVHSFTQNRPNFAYADQENNHG